MRLLYFFSICLVILSAGCRRPASDYLERGQRQMKENNPVEATLSFRRAIQADPKNGPAHKLLGESALKQGDIQQAFQAYAAAAELLPGDVAVQEQLADLVLGAYLTNTKRPAYLKEKLLSLADKIEKLNPQSFEVWRVRGMVAGADGNAPEALEHFRKANATAPLRPGLKLLELQAMLDSGDKDGAEAAAYALIEKAPHFGPVYDWLLRIYQNPRNLKKAEGLLLRKVEANPDNIAYHLQLARFYSQVGKAAAADNVVGQSLQRGSGNSSVIQVGDFYLSFGDTAKAASFYRQGLEMKSPVPLQARKRLAVTRGMQGDFRAAISEVEAARKLDRHDLEAVRIEGELRARSGQPKDLDIAISIFRELIIRAPSDGGARYGLAAALLAKGDSSAARQELLRCVSFNPRHGGAIALLAKLYRASNEPDNLLRMADAVLNADPASGAGKLVRAEALIGLKRFGEARAALLPMAQDQAISSEATLLLAKTHAAERDFSAAEQLLRRVVAASSKSDTRAISALSDVLLVQGRKPEVVDLWRKELARIPKSAAVRRGLAKALYLDGRYDQAAAEYRTLLAADPNDVEATALLGASLYARGEREEALTLFKKAAEIKGANQTLIEGMIGYLYQFDTSGATAELYYRRILAREPDNHFVLNNLAYFLAEKGTALDEAAKLAGRAVAIQKDNADYQDTLAFVSIKLGKASEAESTLSVLAKNAPSNPSYRFHLGLALAKLGRKAEARQELSAALARSSSPELRSRIQNAISAL